MRNVIPSITILVISLYATYPARADVPPGQVREVEYLLEFVQNSRCVINRNGTDYPAEKGVAHIKKKYDYFRDDINSTEDFITYSATKSTMSGKDYSVTCPGRETIRAQDWLLEVLLKLRSGK